MKTAGMASRRVPMKAFDSVIRSARRPVTMEPISRMTPNAVVAAKILVGSSLNVLRARLGKPTFQA